VWRAGHRPGRAPTSPFAEGIALRKVRRILMVGLIGLLLLAVIGTGGLFYLPIS
jgi:hypothetical protein